ncbi:carbohydrate ABC transporter permease [Microbacterium sp. ASV49]|uniref:Carbohydrate ABC transporter permease n=1 Tax=Microbacterium candidum TaxID=3041922 RepID=A0ABT7MWB2_9MICO|nr:carbohydrate ABC transporter permease [Microbacterium sp. ASV49]MDL9978737.1 carbohydrate ABC transporter permease [Microbacterium sp. ASV49]
MTALLSPEVHVEDDAPSYRPRRRRRRLSPARFTVVVVCAAIAASTIYPFVFMAFTSLKTPRDYVDNKLGLPIPATFENFVTALSGDLGVSFVNSVIVVGAGTILTVILGCMAGFAFAFLRFLFRATLLRLIMIIMVLPVTVLIPPIFKVVLDLGLVNTYPGLVLLYVGLSLPAGVYMMATFFMAVPKELVESARIDGATPWRVFRSIAVPLARPAFITLGTFTFLGLWNELLFALLIMSSPEQRTLPVAITLLRQSVQNPTLVQDAIIAAGLLMSAALPFLLFILFNRQITQGMVAGALK